MIHQSASITSITSNYASITSNYASITSNTSNYAVPFTIFCLIRSD